MPRMWRALCQQQRRGGLDPVYFMFNVGLMNSAPQAINIIIAKTVTLMMKFDIIHRPTSHVLLRLKFLKKTQIIKFQN